MEQSTIEFLFNDNSCVAAIESSEMEGRIIFDVAFSLRDLPGRSVCIQVFSSMGTKKEGRCIQRVNKSWISAERSAFICAIGKAIELGN